MSERFVKQILVVDDEKEYRLIIEKILMGLSYSCEGAGDAFEAMEKLGLRHFDLVLADIFMANRSGLELMQEARANWPSLDFIIMTGHTEYSY